MEDTNMPKKVAELTNEEKQRYNKDLFVAIDAMEHAGKSPIYALNVIKNKRKNSAFSPNFLKDKDLREAELAFDQIFRYGNAFYRKYDDGDLLDQFRTEDTPVRQKVETTLESKGVMVNDRKKLDQYVKAYIIYAMTNKDEKVFFDPGIFDEKGKMVHLEPGKTIDAKDGESYTPFKVSQNIANIRGTVPAYDAFGDPLSDFDIVSVEPLDEDVFDVKDNVVVNINDKINRDVNIDNDINININNDDNNINNDNNDNDDNLGDDIEEDLNNNNFDKFTEVDQDLNDDISEAGENEAGENEAGDDGRSFFEMKNADRFTDFDSEGNPVYPNFSRHNDYINEIREGVILPREEDEDEPVNENENFEGIEDINPDDIEGQLAFVADVLNRSNIKISGKDAQTYGASYKNLHDAAVKEGAAAEDKVKWAVNVMALHINMVKALTDIKNNQPELFNYNKDTIELREAFKVNSNMCSSALADVKVDIFDALADHFTSTVNYSKFEVDSIGKEAARNNIETEIARAMYLGKLKHEFLNVHGTEEEMKAWKQDILNEIISDKFDANVEAFKHTEVFKNVKANISSVEGLDQEKVRNIISKGITKTAEAKYNEAYHYFADGVKNDQEIADVERITSELSELKTIGISIGADRTEEHNSFGSNMFFDTIYIKKKANLYGQTVDISNDLRLAAVEQKELEDDIRISANNSKNEFLKAYNLAKAELDKNANRLDIIRMKDFYQEKFDRTQKELAQITDVNSREFKLMADNLQQYGDTLSKLQLEQKNAGFGDLVEEELRKKQKDFNEKYTDLDKKLERLEYVASENEKYALQQRKAQEAKDKEELPAKLRAEDAEYRTALQNNDQQTIDRITKARRDRDNAEKAANPNLYIGINNSVYKDMDYNLESYNTCKANMIATFKKYTDKSEEQTLKFNESMAKNDEIEPKYYKNTTVRPHRDEFKLSDFEVAEEAAPELDMELNLDNVVISNVAVNAAPAPIPVQIANPEQVENPLECINNAIAAVARRRSRLYGSEEYDRILNNLRQLQTDMTNGVTDQASIDKCRMILAEMKRYTDRKLDEKDARRGNETGRARNRREAMGDAMTNIELAIDALEVQNNVYAQDHTLVDIKNELAITRELTKSNDRIFNDINNQLNGDNPNYTEAMNVMLAYLNNNYNKYYDSNNHTYSFRREDNGPGVRIPSSKEEKVYKTVLECTEKLINHYLEHLEKTDYQKLPRIMSTLNHISVRNGQTISARDKYGLDIIPKSIRTTVYKGNTLEECRDNYKNMYSALLNKKRYENQDNYLYNNDAYSPDTVLSYQEKQLLIQSALSTLFLEDKINRAVENQEFNYDEMNNERLKFISTITDSKFYNTLLNNVSNYANLGGLDDPADVKQYNSDMFKAINTPVAFNEVMVTAAIVDTISVMIRDTAAQVSNPNHDKDAVKKSLEEIDRTMKIARKLNLSDKIEEANNFVGDRRGLKGANLSETVNNLRTAVKNSEKIKKAQPTKGVQL